VWTVSFDVSYVFHDTASEPLPADIQSLYSDLQSNVGITPADYRQRFQSGTSAISGFQAGDNVVIMGTTNGSTGGVTESIFEPTPAGATFGKPISNALMVIANNPANIFESLIHETGHAIGFDERYSGGPLPGSHEGFYYDFMTAGSARNLDSVAMHPSHISAAAEFALYAANQNTISNRVMSGIHVESTGNRGSVQQFLPGGAVNPAYTTLQQTLKTEVWSNFRAFSLQQLTPTPSMILQSVPSISNPGSLPPNFWNLPPANVPVPGGLPTIPNFNPYTGMQTIFRW
jgi:hypothetical protein